MNFEVQALNDQVDNGWRPFKMEAYKKGAGTDLPVTLYLTYNYIGR